MLDDGEGMQVIPSRGEGEGPRGCKLPLPRKPTRTLTEGACGNAKAIKRLSGPSAGFASFRMTRAVIFHSLFSLPRLSPGRKPDKS